MPILGFHPFQGRPSFGQTYRAHPFSPTQEEFPSLSGKTFIRTDLRSRRSYGVKALVSIPFREDLHSDSYEYYTTQEKITYGFHPFQGRPSFGPRSLKLHPFSPSQGFHPFQGRPSFGPATLLLQLYFVAYGFPSLSGKTFIRTRLD